MPIKEVREGGKKPRNSKKNKQAFEDNARVLKGLVESGFLLSGLKDIFTTAAIENQKHASIAEPIQYKDDVTTHLGENNEFTGKQPKAVFYRKGYKLWKLYIESNSESVDKKTVNKLLYIKKKTDAVNIQSTAVLGLEVVVEGDPEHFGREMTEILSNSK